MTKLQDSTEVWKDVPGYENYYQVSSFGKVKSITRVVKCHWKETQNTKFVKGRLLKPQIIKGYHHVTLCKNECKFHARVHRLVLFAFVGYDKNKPEVNHIDCNKANNRLDNLEWCTRIENSNHARANKIQRVYKKPVYQYSLNRELIKIWDGACDAQLAGVCHISTIRNSIKKFYKNTRFIWSFKPLDDVA